MDYMRRVLRFALPGLLLLSLMAGSALAQTRIGTIDMRKVFDNYYKTKQARVRIEADNAEKEKDHTAMISDWKKLKEDYQTARTAAADQAVAAEEKEKRQKLAEDLLKKIKDTEEALVSFEKTARATYEERVSRMKSNILDEIRGVVSAEAKAANYNLVLDVAGDSVNGVPIVLYSNGDSDLTTTVLSRLNAAADESAKPDAKPADTKK